MSRVEEIKQDLAGAVRELHQMADRLTVLSNQIQRAETEGQYRGDKSSILEKAGEVGRQADKILNLKAKLASAEKEEAQNNKTPGHGH